MNDTNTRLQESLLPISHNQPGVAGQRQTVQTTVTATRSGAGYVPVSTSSYSVRSSSQEDSWSNAKRYCWWIAVVLTVVIVFLIVGLKLFFFKPINHDQPALDNSTATEPNTKTSFNLLLSGPKNKVMSITGAAAWLYTIPIPTHPKLVLGAVGYYVERVEGKRRLRPFKGEEITDERFEDIKDVLIKGGMSQSMRVVLATTPPSGRMLELWKDTTFPILDRDCPNLAENEWNAFSAFFPEPFAKGDDFSFEWREGTDLYAYHKGEERTKAKRIGGPCMAKALFESQLEAQKSALLNLLDDFFTR